MSANTRRQSPLSAARRLSTPMILVQNFAFCTLIALVLWLLVPAIGRYGFYNNFIHAQAIGNSICLLAIGTAWLARMLHITDQWLTVFSILLVTPLGTYAGLAIASWWLDLPGNAFSALDKDQLIASVITAVIASIAFNWHLASKQKLLRLELVASEERRKADNAHHAMLRAQLEPHMLFNTLANLRALIASDTDRAIQMLDRLDSFLRETLSASRSVSNTLAHEFSVLEDYLELMGVRLADRLNYQLQLPADCRDLKVPSLILQPLVENAIRHGIEPEIDGGSISVEASRQGDQLTLTVADTGSGMSRERIDEILSDQPQASSSATGGLGLSSLRERLQESFTGDATLTIASVNTDPAIKGTRITICLPIHTSAP